jgi:hypothetical protein
MTEITRPPHLARTCMATVMKCTIDKDPTTCDIHTATGITLGRHWRNPGTEEQELTPLYELHIPHDHLCLLVATDAENRHLAELADMPNHGMSYIHKDWYWIVMIYDELLDAYYEIDEIRQQAIQNLRAREKDRRKDLRAKRLANYHWH